MRFKHVHAVLKQRAALAKWCGLNQKRNREQHAECLAAVELLKWAARQKAVESRSTVRAKRPAQQRHAKTGPQGICPSCYRLEKCKERVLGMTRCKEYRPASA